jgi:hypothetical protein
LVAQRAPAANEVITFEQYRDSRIHDLTQRRARLAQQLAAPNLSAAEKKRLERQKTDYDRLAAMPAEEGDRHFRERFDEIDANHDGKLDPEELAVWREKQREYYQQQATERAVNRFPDSPQPHAAASRTDEPVRPTRSEQIVGARPPRHRQPRLPDHGPAPSTAQSHQPNPQPQLPVAR